VDVRISGRQIAVDFHLDTISTLEFIAKSHPSIDPLDRAAAPPFRQEVYDHLNLQFRLSADGQRCDPSEMFNFLYVPEVDKYSVQYLLQCPVEINELTIDFKVFSEQTGMNTTIATVLTNRGGERYVFTRESRAVIRMGDLTGRPRDVTRLMRNYDPLKGFRSEADRQAALGIIAGPSTPVTPNHRTTNGAPAFRDGFWSAAVALLQLVDPLLFLLCMVIGIRAVRQRGMAALLFILLCSAGMLAHRAGLVQISFLIEALLLCGLTVFAAVHVVVGTGEAPRLQASAIAGLLSGISAGDGSGSGTLPSVVVGIGAGALCLVSVAWALVVVADRLLPAWRRGGQGVLIGIAAASVLLLGLRLYFAFS